MKPDEEQLVADCLSNKPEAYGKLYEHYAPQMYGICLRYARTSAAAEDILHDGFIKVFDSLHKLKNPLALHAWIRSIMIHTAISTFNAENPIADPDKVNDTTDDLDHDINTLTDSIDLQIILQAIQQLPDRYRITFNLVEIEGFSVADAAKELQVTDSTIRSNLHRAKKILAKNLAHLRHDFIP